MVRKNPGFTIVELLIVIVVIAILAAISIVAYTGIQNKANDSAVQADMRAIGGIIEQYNVTEGSYPIGANQAQLLAIFESMNISPSKSSYDTPTGTGANFLYMTVPTSDKFLLIGRSKSGNEFYYSSDTQGVAEYTLHSPSLNGYADEGQQITRRKILGYNASPNSGESFWGYGASGWANEFK